MWDSQIDMHADACQVATKVHGRPVASVLVMCFQARTAGVFHGQSVRWFQQALWSCLWCAGIAPAAVHCCCSQFITACVVQEQWLVSLACNLWLALGRLCMLTGVCVHPQCSSYRVGGLIRQPVGCRIKTAAVDGYLWVVTPRLLLLMVAVLDLHDSHCVE